MEKFEVICKNCGEKQNIIMSYEDNIKFPRIYIVCENCNEEEFVPKDFVENINDKLQHIYEEENLDDDYDKEFYGDYV
jgi:RNase P subunit RPR2